MGKRRTAFSSRSTSVAAGSHFEYSLRIEILESARPRFIGARRRLGFLLCGQVLMPDPGHALIWAGRRLGISEVIHDVKKVWARRRHGAGIHHPCSTGVLTGDRR